MVKELLRTIPHALSGRSKFGRTLMYMSPVAFSTIDLFPGCFCHSERSRRMSQLAVYCVWRSGSHWSEAKEERP